jgi:hypothetical protein
MTRGFIGAMGFCFWGSIGPEKGLMCKVEPLWQLKQIN